MQADAPDLIDLLLALDPGGAVAVLRQERAEIRGHTEGAYRALLLPGELGGISRAERAAMGVRVARRDGDAALAGHYEAMLGEGGTAAEIVAAGAERPDGPGRLALLMRWADLVSEHPGRVLQASVDALSAVGLSAPGIVAATQLVAFVPFQMRLLAGLRAMAGAAGEAVPRAVAAEAAFTMDDVPWMPRVPPVDAAHATQAQLAALEACPPAVRRSTYFLTLALDPASLAERGALFNAVMYAPRGLPRVERELATAVVSLVNGCVYCTSVHARRHAELSHDPAVMQGLMAEGLHTPLEPRARAIVDFTAKLTATPGAVGAADLAPLREAGLQPLELLDLVHAIAMFANANRLMQALGETG